MIEANHWEKRLASRVETSYRYDNDLWNGLRVKEKELDAKKQQQTHMLPSPESLAGSSASSTPVSRPAESPAQKPKPAEAEPTIQLQQRNDKELYTSVSPYYIYSRSNLGKAYYHAISDIMKAEKYLNLPTVAKHFPRTFTRMINSSLGYQDTHEPDMEDDDGELMWPNQTLNGEGLAWVCTMGRALVKEYGKKFGYVGYEGIVPIPHRTER